MLEGFKKIGCAADELPFTADGGDGLSDGAGGCGASRGLDTRHNIRGVIKS